MGGDVNDKEFAKITQQEAHKLVGLGKQNAVLLNLQISADILCVISGDLA